MKLLEISENLKGQVLHLRRNNMKRATEVALKSGTEENWSAAHKAVKKHGNLLHAIKRGGVEQLKRVQAHADSPNFVNRHGGAAAVTRKAMIGGAAGVVGAGLLAYGARKMFKGKKKPETPPPAAAKVQPRNVKKPKQRVDPTAAPTHEQNYPFSESLSGNLMAFGDDALLLGMKYRGKLRRLWGGDKPKQQKEKTVEATERAFGNLMEYYARKNPTDRGAWHGLPQKTSWHQIHGDKQTQVKGADAKELERRHLKGISRRKTVRDVALVGAGAYGTHAAYKHAKPLVTGRTDLYHGTSKANAAKMRVEGLRYAARTKKKGITDMVLGKTPEGEQSKHAVSLTKSKSSAKSYGAQSEWIEKGAKGGPFGRATEVPKHSGEVLHYQVPLWREGIKKHVIENPELKNIDKQVLMHPIEKWAAKRELGDNTVVMKNKMPNQFQVGHKNFKGLSVKEFKQYATKHPGRVAAGAAIGLGGAYLGYKTAKYAKKAWDARKERKAQIAQESTDACFYNLMESLRF